MLTSSLLFLQSLYQISLLYSPNLCIKQHITVVIARSGQQWTRARVRNVNNLDVVELNRIRNLIYACVKLLLANFIDVENVAYMNFLFDITSRRRRPVSRVSMQGVCHLQAVISHCILCHISCANAVHGPRPVQKNVPRPNRSNIGPEWPSTRTWTCTNTTAPHLLSCSIVNYSLSSSSGRF